MDSAARQLEDTVRSVAKAARLSRDGQKALLQWSTWVSYATALTVYDPSLSQEPGWKIVLPIDPMACRAHLHRLLLRAGESEQIAHDAVEAFYQKNPLPSLHDAIEAFQKNDASSSAVHGAAQREMAWQAWLRRLPSNDLPKHVVRFELLPAAFRETALLTANLAGRDCRNTPGLNRLDLRFLYAPGADFEGCDLSDSNFFRGELSGSNLQNTRIGGAVLPACAMRARPAPSTPPYPSTPPSRYSNASQDDRSSAASANAWRGTALLI